MRAWVVDRITPERAIRLADLGDPMPSAMQYHVRIEASGENYFNTPMIRGAYQSRPALPFIPGVEVANAIGAPGAWARAL
ncbi:hypothetical protein [Roseomonas chloroacetimidivorans]|uniref:hypothetical protein n=1 Tax=Roseomonas chloroacetimidivorans TaxID=1766656 RepID=UPI003C77AA8C